MVRLARINILLATEKIKGLSGRSENAHEVCFQTYQILEFHRDTLCPDCYISQH